MELDPLVNTLRHKVARVDAEILAAVRQQASSGSRARADLASAKATIEELFAKIHEIQRKAEQSDLMVQVGGRRQAIWVEKWPGQRRGPASITSVGSHAHAFGWCIVPAPTCLLARPALGRRFAGTSRSWTTPRST